MNLKKIRDASGKKNNNENVASDICSKGDDANIEILEKIYTILSNDKAKLERFFECRYETMERSTLLSREIEETG